MLEKTLMLEKTGGKRRRGRQRLRGLDSVTNLNNMNLRKLWKTVTDRRALRDPCSPWGGEESDTT